MLLPWLLYRSAMPRARQFVPLRALLPPLRLLDWRQFSRAAVFVHPQLPRAYVPSHLKQMLFSTPKGGSLT
jgi:hypothetical protein